MKRFYNTEIIGSFNLRKVYRHIKYKVCLKIFIKYSVRLLRFEKEQVKNIQQDIVRII